MNVSPFCSICGSRWLACFVVAIALIHSPRVFAEGDTEKSLQSTHKQTQVIKPLVDGKPVQLNTYCLDQDGDILACVGGSEVRYVMNEDGSQQAKTIQSPQQIQWYSPDGELLRATDVPFKPTAINVAPDGTIFVAGMGRVAHVAKDGRVLTTVDSPHIGDIASFRHRIEEAAKKQLETNKERYKDQVARVEERIKALEEKKSEKELTSVEERRLTAYKEQKSMYEQQLQVMDRTASTATGEAAVNRKLGITALAVTSKDLFLCAVSVEGTGYEVWRMTHEFSEPTKVVSSLGGCCGQCDIQANESHLVLAENTKFKVALLDRDGKRESDFGKGDRKAADGFGSCCNPMNVRCCDNGDIITAESSVGAIKRFNKDGELIGVVGKAKIGGGCKHVSVAFDAKRDRYYMMNVDKDHICVMVPNAEAGDPTPEEVLAKQAREGLGAKLVGAWAIAGTKPPEDKKDQKADEPAVAQAKSNEKSDSDARPDVKPEATKAIPASRVAISRVLIPRVTSDPYSSSYLQFDEDGVLHTEGGVFKTDQTWECVRQEGNTLFVAQATGGIQYLEYRVEFAGNDEILLSITMGERVLSSNRFHRIEPRVKTAEASE